MKVQQELMRHASIQTTMNVYGQAMPESKREANGKGNPRRCSSPCGRAPKVTIFLIGDKMGVNRFF